MLVPVERTVKDVPRQPAHVVHPFAPVWNAQSRVLVLGSFPSVRSREVGFYYGHPQNRFWRVLAALYQESLPLGVQERRAFALRHGVALWDALASCDIVGSSDQSIRNAVPNDIASLLNASAIERVFLNGQRAYAAYRKHCGESCGLPAMALPSTSAANAAWSLERLVEAWRVIL
ncbi:MAG: DNA-deoxyinosine glycosylase [Clostridiales bacterium]|nr:DNA-deoxyinosine glycosylase [Clostridiales bacterium]MDY4009445.1 DNA-deoxyinosine glycosylase [Candidatus Limiplasma sp.]